MAEEHLRWLLLLLPALPVTVLYCSVNISARGRRKLTTNPFRLWGGGRGGILSQL